MCLVTVLQMKKMLNNGKHYWQEDSTEEKASSKANYLLFFLIVMRLVILLLDVQRRITIEEMINTKVEEMKIGKSTKTKEKSATL